MFQIANPCSRRWTELPGGERRRYCGDCGKFVHAVELYSDAELAAMGPVCGYVRGETAVPPQTRRAIIAGAVLTTISPLLAQEGRLRVVVKDVAGSVVPEASVSVGDRKMSTDKDGVASFTGLPAGRYEVLAQSPGFKNSRRSVNVGNGPEIAVDVRLDISAVGEGGLALDLKSGQLRVDVRDGAGGAVVKADVQVKCNDGESARFRTDAAGTAKFGGLANGDCEVIVNAPGFREWRGTSRVASVYDDPLQVRLEVSDPGTKIAVRPKPAAQRFWDWLSSCTRK